MFLISSSVLQVIEAGILNKTVLPLPAELVDGRHFQKMEDNTIKAASGHVQATSALCLRRFKGHDTFLGRDWFAMLKNCGHEPSMLGFIVKNVMISHLAKEGLKLDGEEVGGIRILEMGTKYPNLADPKLKLRKPIFYIPTIKGHHNAIDAILICPDTPTLNIIAAHITLDNRPENSEVMFAPHWNDFLPMGGPVLPPGFSQYELIFLWLVEDPERFRFKNGVVPAGVVKIDNVDFHHPEYRRVVEGVKEVCPRLAQGLELARRTHQNEDDFVKELYKIAGNIKNAKSGGKERAR